MTVQLLPTKCSLPPPRANRVARARLGETLPHGLLAGHKVTLISAPAGYGKCTLAVGWARQTGLLEDLPPACHLLLLSREDPPLPLLRLRVRDEMTELRAQELRFTVTEAEQFFNQTMRLGLSPDWVAALETRTEGWIAYLAEEVVGQQHLEQTNLFLVALDDKRDWFHPGPAAMWRCSHPG
ncbi:MAG: hypothetical protein EOM24_15520 [Chloroflexia bacterium]|nr:hypothetical protein [Chloroflexia bacterium]